MIISNKDTKLPSGWKIINGYLVGPGANLVNADFNWELRYTITETVTIEAASGAGMNVEKDRYIKILRGSFNLSKMDLTNCNLTGANLSFCDLSEVIFTGANLTGVNLTGANLTNEVTGHNSIENGMMSTDEIIRKYNAKPLDELLHNVLIINITMIFQLYILNMFQSYHVLISFIIYKSYLV